MKNISYSFDTRQSSLDTACRFERSMTFGEVAEMAARCESISDMYGSRKSYAPPLTFVVPNFQVVASISRFVE